MTRADRLRSAAVAALLLLAACSGSNPATPAAVPDAAPQCRVGADGGPTLADRGIGGTGARPSPGLDIADKGIGGTGIVGVITGFASICLGGREVRYDSALPIQIDGRPGAIGDLRAGQLAVVEASGPEARLQARHVLIRHEVTGPVQGIEPGGILRIAGQRVAIATSTLGDTRPAIGSRVAVSGFRDPDGTILATRLDPHETPDVVISGTLVREGARLHIGTAEIRLEAGLVLPPGHEFVLAGHWSNGVFYAGTIAPDPLSAGPLGYFGGGLFGNDVQLVVFESYAGIEDGRLLIGRIQRRSSSEPFGRAVIEFQRRPDGALQPAMTRQPGLRGLNGSGVIGRSGEPARSPRGFEPAPIPSRGGEGRERAGERFSPYGGGGFYGGGGSGFTGGGVGAGGNRGR